MGPRQISVPTQSSVMHQRSAPDVTQTCQSAIYTEPNHLSSSNSFNQAKRGCGSVVERPLCIKIFVSLIKLREAQVSITCFSTFLLICAHLFGPPGFRRLGPSVPGACKSVLPKVPYVLQDNAAFSWEKINAFLCGLR